MNRADSDAVARDGRSHYGLIALLSLAAFGSAASLRIADAQLPQLANEFQVGLSGAAQVVTAFSLAYGLMQLAYGPLGERFGKWHVVGLATLACAITAGVCALAVDFQWLLIARVLAGATAAGIIPLSMAWVGDAIAYEHRQPVLARFLLGQITGLAGGQFIGGWAAEYATWRLPFVLLAVWFGVIGMLLLATRRRAERAAPVVPSHRGVIADAIHVAQQPWACVILTVVFIEGVVLYGAFAFIASHLHQAYGISLARAGAMLMLYAAGGVSFAFGSARLVRGLGEPGLARVGGLLIALGFATTALSPVWWTAPVAIMLSGLGFYMLHNTLQTNATQMAPTMRGVAVSLFAAAFFLGQSVGVALASLFVERFGTAAVVATGGAAVLILALCFAHLRAQRVEAN